MREYFSYSKVPYNVGKGIAKYHKIKLKKEDVLKEVKKMSKKWATIRVSKKWAANLPSNG